MDFLDDAFDLIDTALGTMGVETEDSKDTAKKIQKEADEAGIHVLKENEVDTTQHKIFYGLEEVDRNQAVYEQIIPACYKDASFDSEKIKDNLRAAYKKDDTMRIYRFNEYESVCNGILSAIRMKKLPTKSYIIGAPNGFGKTSFVVESLITLRKHGFRVAPYISLTELSYIRRDNEEKLMKPFYKSKDNDSKYGNDYYEVNKLTGYVKSPEIVTGRYSFSEYINADCLFVSLSGIVSKVVESNMLFQLLNIRGIKGLPTIVMVSTSLKPYLEDAKYGDTIWNEIITHTEREFCYDRLLHVSCYKKRRLSKLDDKGSIIENDTGIVN